MRRIARAGRQLARALRRRPNRLGLLAAVRVDWPLTLLDGGSGGQEHARSQKAKGQLPDMAAPSSAPDMAPGAGTPTSNLRAGAADGNFRGLGPRTHPLPIGNLPPTKGHGRMRHTPLQAAMWEAPPTAFNHTLAWSGADGSP